MPPIFPGLKPYEVSQENEKDGTITLYVQGIVYKEKEIKKRIEEAQQYLEQVKKIDYSKYASDNGKKQLEKMKKLLIYLKED